MLSCSDDGYSDDETASVYGNSACSCVRRANTDVPTRFTFVYIAKTRRDVEKQQKQDWKVK